MKQMLRKDVPNGAFFRYISLPENGWYYAAKWYGPPVVHPVLGPCGRSVVHPVLGPCGRSVGDGWWPDMTCEIRDVRKAKP